MTEAEAIGLIRTHLESRFPKSCSKCARIFPTLKDYLLASTPLGDPVSYDAEAEDWNPVEPIGTFSLANCACGTTLSLNSDGLATWTLVRLMIWARGHAKRSGLTFRQLLVVVRTTLRRDVLGEAE